MTKDKTTKETVEKVPQETKGGHDVRGGDGGSDGGELPPISYGNSEERVLGMLKLGWGCKRISKKLGISLTTTKRLAKRLKLLSVQNLEVPQEMEGGQSALGGYDKRRTFISYGTYVSDGTLLIKKDKKTSDGKTKTNIVSRCHNVKIKIPIIREAEGELKGWDILQLRHNVQKILNKDGMRLVMTTKNVLIELPPLYLEDGEDVRTIAYSTAKAIKDELNATIKGLVLAEPLLKIQLVGQHQAIQNDLFAAWAKKQNISINTGNVHIDASDVLPELEFTDKDKADQHFNKYKDFIEDVVNKDTPLLSSVVNDVSGVRKDLAECVQILKITVDITKLNAEQLQLLSGGTKIKADVVVPDPMRLYYVG